MEVTTPEIQALADAAQEFAILFFNRAPGQRHLIIAGHNGVGKTHVAESLYRWANAIKIDSFLKWKTGSQVPRIEKFEWAKVVSLETSEFRLWLLDRSETQLLFLEDVGAEVDRFKTSEPIERLRQVLDDFKNKFLVITTNFGPDEWETKFDLRVADRLLRHSKIITLTETPSFAAR